MSSPKIIAVIPARMNSSRFPGKPLALILERPMIEHVFRRVAMCDFFDQIYVATCDEEIREAVENFGGTAVMTSDAHERATDRVAEVAEIVSADIVVMIQGDEPMITSGMIALSLAPMLADSSINCVNLVSRILNQEEYLNRNTIKTVMNLCGNALYFSRAPIPALNFEQAQATPVFKQVCVIPFRSDFLRKFACLAPTPLEQAESIDMLRIIEHGGLIRLVETEINTHAIDTPDDLQLVETMMKNDSICLQYENQIIRKGERNK